MRQESESEGLTANQPLDSRLKHTRGRKGRRGRQPDQTATQPSPIKHSFLVQNPNPQGKEPNLRAPKLCIPPQNGNYSGTPPAKRKNLSRINDSPSHDEGTKRDQGKTSLRKRTIHRARKTKQKLNSTSKMQSPAP